MRTLLLVVLLAAVPARAGEPTPIGDVVRNRDAYANRTVSVEGTVAAGAFGYGADGAYTLQGADDARIAVFVHGATPAPGAHLLVTGTVGRKPPDEEFDFPPAIIEQSRETR